MSIKTLPILFEKNLSKHVLEMDRLVKEGLHPRRALLQILGVEQEFLTVRQYVMKEGSLFINPWSLNLDKTETWLYETLANQFFFICTRESGYVIISGVWDKGTRGSITSTECFLVYSADLSAYMDLCTFLATGVEVRGRVFRPHSFEKEKAKC